MATLNSRTLNQPIAAINKQLDKYGHVCTVHEASPGTGTMDAKVLFSNYDLALVSGSIIINPNYKLLLKAQDYTFAIEPTASVIVNGASLAIVTAKKITPNGAKAIIWELEATGGVVPYDTPSIAAPTITAPTNDTSNYPSTEGAGGWIITCTGNNPVIIGESSFALSTWQIATDDAFVTVVNEGTSTTTSYTTPDVLLRNTVYYVRAKYKTSTDLESGWSAVNKFSLDTLPVPAAIDKPTIRNTKAASGYMHVNEGGVLGGRTQVAFKSSDSSNTPQVVINASEFSSSSGALFGSITFQISNAPDFSYLVTNLTQSSAPGFDPAEGSYWGEVWMGYRPDGFVFSPANFYWARVKYTSSLGEDSEWSDTLSFICPAYS